MIKASTKSDKVLVVILLVLVMLAVNAAWVGWLVMIVFGIIHSYSHGWPAIGFWPCLGIGAAVTFLLGGLKG